MKEHSQKFLKFYYVEMIAELHSFSRAAEKLYISQPALTKSIGKLEQELGVKLFDRASHPLQLTYAGERYLAGMRNIIAMQNQLEQELAEIADMKKGRLTVGIPDSRGPRWLPRILPIFLRDCPGIDVRIVEGVTGELERELVRENIDIAVVTTLPQMVADLQYEEVHQEQLMILSSPKHPMFQNMDLTQALKNRNALHYISPERLDGQPYIAHEPEQGLYRSATHMFERFNIRPQKVVTLSNTSSARDLATSGVGFVVAPTHSAYSGKLEKRDVLFCSITDPPTYRSVIISYKMGKPLSSAARRFIDIVKTVANTDPGLTPVAFPLVHDLGD